MRLKILSDTRRRWFSVIAMSVLLSARSAAADEEVPPLLMVETGVHSAGISDAATDSAGRWLVTASVDKTARVWDVGTGKLSLILRPPAANAYWGRLNAVAMSPDGGTIAVGGSTGKSLADDTYSVYLFDRSSGQLRQRINGFAKEISALAWSRKGSLLAAGIAGGGVRVFDARNGDEVGRDNEFKDSVHGLDFSPDGNMLVASSWDGQLRRYKISEMGLIREVRRPTAGGNQPQRVKFSPDGNLIAVGYFDTSQVNVLQARDLSTAWIANTRGAERRARYDGSNLITVAWSADGEYLFAGGRWQSSDQFPIRRWSAAGRGAFVDFPATNNTIKSLLALPDGRMIFTGDPTWGILSNDGSMSTPQKSPVADFRIFGVRVSRDGSRVAFRYHKQDLNPMLFDVTTASLQPYQRDLPETRTHAPGIVLENWKNEERPLLNKKALSLLLHDEARSVDVSVDGTRVAVGGNYRIYLFDQTGRRLWLVPSFGATWGTTISDDGRWVVVADAYGTIRWLRMQDGTEVLRLFPHADRTRWVMWTPSGYYNASIGAEDLFGWHVTRGFENAADFFPAGRFRDVFYRPDVVERVLKAGSEAEALKGANIARGASPISPSVKLEKITPPVVTLLSPDSQIESSSSSVKVRFSTRTLSDAPLLGLKFRVNGQPVEVPGARLMAGLKAGGDTAHEFDVPVPKQDSEILIFAENRFGVSTPGVVRMKWKDPEQSWGEFAARPKLYVLAVGVSAYPSADMKIEYAAKDARDFVAALTKNSNQLYRDVEVKLLTDASATRDEVLDGLEWLRKQVTHRDVGVMFMAGHGVNDSDGTYYFLPYNADPERLKRTGIIHHEIRNTLSSLPGKAIFFIDTCHAGNALGTGRRGISNDMSAMANELASAENGVVVFSASTGRQYSLENSDWGNGAFTKALVEGLSGAADFQKTGRITHKMLDFYVSERVKALTNGKQTPVTIIPQGVPDFPVAIVSQAVSAPAK